MSRRVCPGCTKGEEPVLLDGDGTLSRLSGKPGEPGHAVDDFWWYCEDYKPDAVARLRARLAAAEANLEQSQSDLKSACMERDRLRLERRPNWGPEIDRLCSEAEVMRDKLALARSFVELADAQAMDGELRRRRDALSRALHAAPDHEKGDR